MSSALLISYHLLSNTPIALSLPVSGSLPPRIPYDNTTALNDEIADGWVKSARSRGTADLLWSCITTLTLCVYTAIHLNIPRIGGSRRKQHARKAKWTTIGIFAPEFVLFTAWQQFWSAKKLCTELDRIYREQNKEKLAESVQPSKIEKGTKVCSNNLIDAFPALRYIRLVGVRLGKPQTLSPISHTSIWFMASTQSWEAS